MRSIRKFAYASILTLSIFAAQPTPAAAEDARGTFTLSHEVHCQNWVLRPGDYRFSVKTIGASEYLLLRPLNGSRTEAMLLVNEVESPLPNEVSRLVLVSRDGQSFASSMELPAYDMSLHFTVPRESLSK